MVLKHVHGSGRDRWNGRKGGFEGPIMPLCVKMDVTKTIETRTAYNYWSRAGNCHAEWDGHEM